MPQTGHSRITACADCLATCKRIHVYLDTTTVGLAFSFSITIPGFGDGLFMPVAKCAFWVLRAAVFNASVLDTGMHMK